MTQSSVQPSGTTSASRWKPRLRRSAIELTMIGVLYVAYCVSRTLASDAFAPARGHALDLLAFEKTWRIDVELTLNNWFVQYDWIGLASSFWYATAHYIITAGILIWLYLRSATEYVTARRALVLATLGGLAFYLTMPTAPPRLVGGYTDVLALHSAQGWWAADASAPKGMGGLTNELAAFPSLHAGWALWVALVLIRAGVPRIVQGLGLFYAATMTIVIIGTGNHWLVDAIVGWALVLVAFGFTLAWERRSPVMAHEDFRADDPAPDPESQPAPRQA